MKTKSLHRKIKRNKFYLNFLLNYLSPSNILIIYLSQNLDKLICKKQKRIYIKYKKKSTRSVARYRAA